ncbi:MAG TPA: hypothetical protein VFE62_15430 [Gemmataceae bacterium]|nr:hypothetical protein [Gemmataceae bacterium]
MQLMRVIAHGTIVVGGWNVPKWVSYVGIVVFGVLGAGFWTVRQIQRYLA